jgi:hypothetical protein
MSAHSFCKVHTVVHTIHRKLLCAVCGCLLLNPDPIWSLYASIAFCNMNGLDRLLGVYCREHLNSRNGFR